MNAGQRATRVATQGRRYLIFAACCLLPVACRVAAEPPAFVVHSTHDEEPAGPLVRLAADGGVQVGNAAAIAGADVVALRRIGTPLPQFPHDRPYIRLTNGDRIPGRLVSITGEKLLFQADIGKPQEITAPLSAVSAVWLSDAAAAWPASPAGNRMLDEKHREDIVQLTNGDNVAGTVAGWPADGPLRIEVAGREIALPRERVRSIVLSSDLSRPRSPDRPIASSSCSMAPG